MSHISTVKTQVRNEKVFNKTCECLGLSHGVGKTRVYSGQLDGMWVKLKDWQYPVCFKSDGSLTYDNGSESSPILTDIKQMNDGYWGQVSELKAFLREYAKTSVLASAEEQGLSLINEQVEGQELVLELAAY